MLDRCSAAGPREFGCRRARALSCRLILKIFRGPGDRRFRASAAGPSALRRRRGPCTACRPDARPPARRRPCRGTSGSGSFLPVDFEVFPRSWGPAISSGRGPAVGPATRPSPLHGRRSTGARLPGRPRQFGCRRARALSCRWTWKIFRGLGDRRFRASAAGPGRRPCVAAEAHSRSAGPKLDRGSAAGPREFGVGGPGVFPCGWTLKIFRGRMDRRSLASAAGPSVLRRRRGPCPTSRPDARPAFGGPGLFPAAGLGRFSEVLEIGDFERPRPGRAVGPASPPRPIHGLPARSSTAARRPGRGSSGSAGRQGSVLPLDLEDFPWSRGPAISSVRGHCMARPLVDRFDFETFSKSSRSAGLPCDDAWPTGPTCRATSWSLAKLSEVEQSGRRSTARTFEDGHVSQAPPSPRPTGARRRAEPGKKTTPSAHSKAAANRALPRRQRWPARKLLGRQATEPTARRKKDARRPATALGLLERGWPSRPQASPANHRHRPAAGRTTLVRGPGAWHPPPVGISRPARRPRRQRQTPSSDKVATPRPCWPSRPRLAEARPATSSACSLDGCLPPPRPVGPVDADPTREWTTTLR